MCENKPPIKDEFLRGSFQSFEGRRTLLTLAQICFGFFIEVWTGNSVQITLLLQLNDKWITDLTCLRHRLAIKSSQLLSISVLSYTDGFPSNQQCCKYLANSSHFINTSAKNARGVNIVDDDPLLLLCMDLINCSNSACSYWFTVLPFCGSE